LVTICPPCACLPGFTVCSVIRHTLLASISARVGGAVSSFLQEEEKINKADNTSSRGSFFICWVFDSD
jgi:hypothetical protein